MRYNDFQYILSASRMNRYLRYTLFIDECGDPNLEKVDKTFPLFTLCGILVSEPKLQWLENEVNSLKYELWGRKDIVFHSREIRNCSRDFVNLLENEVKRDFILV